jgi:hypothetical protein
MNDIAYLFCQSPLDSMLNPQRSQEQKWPWILSTDNWIDSSSETNTQGWIDERMKQRSPQVESFEAWAVTTVWEGLVVRV